MVKLFLTARDTAGRSFQRSLSRTGLLTKRLYYENSLSTARYVIASDLASPQPVAGCMVTQCQSFCDGAGV